MSQIKIKKLLSLKMHQQLKSAIGQYTTFTDPEWTYILSCFERLTVKKNTELVKFGEVAPALYFINKGAIRTYFLRDVEEFDAGFFFENSFTTSLSSFLHQTPSIRAVEAIEDSELLCLEYTDYQELNDAMINFNVFARRLVEDALVGDDMLNSSLIVDEPETRLENLLKTQPDIIHRVPHRYIASYLDIPLLTLRKMLKAL